MIPLVTILAILLLAAPAPQPENLGDIGAGEGPVFHPSGYLYFSGRNRITRRDLSGAVSVYRENAGTNGLLFDHQGRLVACESRNRRITRTEPDGAITVLADRYEGHRFNSPNDLTIDSRGRIYFTDPRYGRRDDMEMIEGVYRVDAPGQVTRVLGKDLIDRPNGILVSPGDRYLYVADNDNNTVGGARKLWRFGLRPDGAVDPRSRKPIFDWGDARGPDGFKMDQQGRLYVAAGLNKPNPPYETAGKFKGGVYILSPVGKLLDFVPIPQDEVTNCAFGGPDWKTLYITAGGTLWSLRVDTPGRAAYTRVARLPVVLTTDAGADMDDQWALAHLALSPEFDLRGVVTTHAGASSAESSARVAREVLQQMPLRSRPPVIPGSSTPLRSRTEPLANPGVDFLLQESRRHRRLTVLVIGAATDAASTLLLDPTLAGRIEIVAMGFDRWPEGGDPFNVKNDPRAWQALLDSTAPITVGDTTVTARHLRMTRDRAHELFDSRGSPGRYLAGLLVHWLDQETDLVKRVTGDPNWWPVWDEVTVAHLLGLTTTDTHPRPSLRDNLQFDHATTTARITWITSIDEGRLWSDFTGKLDQARR